ncbi:MAG: F0F1 ATP synthase subunit epsilon [Flavobacteriaceae bacterium]|nr:F0F1 ATP synthase subunit epsilon [Flavobacteriaceae bacterium]
MFLEIVTPEAVIFNSDVVSVLVPGVNGKFQLLKNHAAIVSLLVGGSVIIKGDEIQIEKEFESKFTISNNVYSLAINSGTIEMKDDKIIILAD